MIVNLFGSIISTWQNVTETFLDGALVALNSLATNLIRPLPVFGPSFNNVAIAVNNLIVNGLVSTVDVKASVATRVTDAVTTILNRLISVANSIFSSQSSFLQNVATRIINRLTTAFNRISSALAGQGSIFSTIINTIRSIFTDLLGIFLPQLDLCISRLNSLGLTTTVTRMNAYKTNTTAIINNLNANVASQLTTYSTYVNTTTLQTTVSASAISADLLADIADAYNNAAVKDQELTDCLNSTAELAGYLQSMINENMVQCLTASNAEVTAATANIGTNSAALQATANSTITDVCNCVATVTTTSTMLQKAQAKTCADTASAKLTSDPLQTQANTISANLATALATAKTNLDTCVNTMNSQIPDTVDYVDSEITRCVS